MINNYERFRLPDENKDSELLVDVNWNAKDEKTNGCKILKFILPDGKEVMVKREYLNQVLFAIGNPEDQKKLIPQSMETVHWRETVLGVKATKDIRKGEMINFPIKISFPCTLVREIIGEDAWRKEVTRNNRAADPKNIHNLIK